MSNLTMVMFHIDFCCISLSLWECKWCTAHIHIRSHNPQEDKGLNRAANYCCNDTTRPARLICQNWTKYIVESISSQSRNSNNNKKFTICLSFYFVVFVLIAPLRKKSTTDRLTRWLTHFTYSLRSKYGEKKRANKKHMIYNKIPRRTESDRCMIEIITPLSSSSSTHKSWKI